jgi:DNA-binding PadR family transcriptional regulator
VEKLAIPQGRRDLMILTILSREPMHGYGTSQRLTLVSQDHRERRSRSALAVTSALEGA